VTLALPGPASAAELFSDGFESGLSPWSSSAGLNIQSRFTNGGSGFAARSRRSVAFASKTLSPARGDVFARVFVLARRNRGEFEVLRFRDARGRAVAGLSILRNGRFLLRSYVTRRARAFGSRAGIHRGWNDLQMRVLMGRRGRLQVWRDGQLAMRVRRIRLGRGRIGAVDVGNRARRRRYDAVYDDVTIGTTFIRDLTIGAAGNIACDPNQRSYNGGNGSSTACHMRHTSDILVRKNYDAVLALGDNQYICGGLSAYNRSYDPSWGRAYNRTYPVPGDKEYRNTNNAPNGTGCEPPQNFAEGYGAYFANAPGPAPGDAAKFWYSFNLGAWHIVALNSGCGVDNPVPRCDGPEDESPGRTGDSEQYNWLQADLAANSDRCTLAIFHHPRFSSARGGNNPEVAGLWNLLYNEGAELVLNAHEHNYERFRPQNPAGNLDRANGIVQFTVGTGGNSLERFLGAAQTNTAQRDSSSFGVLEVALRSNSWRATFVPEAGDTFTDSATGNCH
jgi:hypothetical protein